MPSPACAFRPLHRDRAAADAAQLGRPGSILCDVRGGPPQPWASFDSNPLPLNSVITPGLEILLEAPDLIPPAVECATDAWYPIPSGRDTTAYLTLNAETLANSSNLAHGALPCRRAAFIASKLTSPCTIPLIGAPRRSG